MTVAFAVAMGTLAAAALVSWRARRLGALAALVGAGLLVAVGVAAALGYAHPTLQLGDWLGFGPISLRADGLAGIFLALTGATGGAVALALAERRHRGAVAGLVAVLLLSTATVIGANQAFFFFLAWEGLTVCLYLIAGADRDQPGALLSGYFTGALVKTGGGALLAAFGLMYGKTGSFRFSDWAAAAPHLGAGAKGVTFVLLLIAFGSKLGVLPFPGALAVSYAGSPRASAASLAVALSAAFYGLWRLVFQTLAPASLWWGEMLLVVGALTALVGILYALAQDDVRRFLGFSTVEHTGIALIGLGVALIGQAVHQPKLAAAGLLAATLHVIAHGLGKTLALLTVDRLEEATGQRRLRELGGLSRALPRGAAGLALATFTLAAIPPFGGFVSEWMTFESLLQGFRLDSALARLLMALAAAAVALTAGLGLLAFAKLYGFTFLGRTRAALAKVRELRTPGLGIAGLTVVTFALGAIAPWEIRLIGHGLIGLLGFDLGPRTIESPLVLGPVYAMFSVLDPTLLAATLPVFAAVAIGVTLLVRRRGGARRAPVWVTGSAAEIESVQYRPAAYSNPIRVVLSAVYGYRREVRAQGDSRNPLTETLVVETRLVAVIERFVYRPLTALALWASGRVKLLQSGRLGTYLIYMLAVLIVILAMLPTLGR